MPKEKTVATSSRIIEIRDVKPSELVANDKNWRVHTPVQREAMRSVFAEVGNIDVLKAVERDGQLILVDGHLRREVLDDGESTIKVAVLDLSDAEVDKALATFDPVSRIAEGDADALQALLSSIDAKTKDFMSTVEKLAEPFGIPAKDEVPEIPSVPAKNDRTMARFIIGGVSIVVDRSIFDAWVNTHRHEAGRSESEWKSFILEKLGLR
jgi:hypothetical protein